VYDLPRILDKESHMTKALEEVFKEAAKLPAAEQDALAEAIRAELGAEKDWDKAFAGSLDVLERLADEAIADHRAGRTKPLDPDAM
jgi:hypothetical protein